MGRSAVNVKGLTRDEKLQLLEELWDSLDPEDVPLTEAQRRELDHRLDQLEREGPGGIPWDQVLREIQGRPT